MGCSEGGGLWSQFGQEGCVSASLCARPFVGQDASEGGKTRGHSPHAATSQVIMKVHSSR